MAIVPSRARLLLLALCGLCSLVACGGEGAGGALSGDASPENPYTDDPAYESVLDLGGADTARLAYGTALGDYRGVAAFSNYKASCGSDSGCWFGIGEGRGTGTYGYHYQCVEYIIRFYSEALGYPNMKGTGNAKLYWINPGTTAAKNLERHANGGTVPPQPDDIIVFDSSSYGHIAIVRDVSESAVTIIQQNWFHNAADGAHSLKLSRNNGTFTVSSLGSSGSYPVLGWLRQKGTTAQCGDGLVTLGEECDGSNLSGKTCLTAGFDYGPLACTPSCQLDTSQCSAAACGNAMIEAGEACEAGQLGGATCQALGFDGGSLACAADCDYDVSGCGTQTATIDVAPAQNLWTPDYVAQTSCTCEQGADCHAIYVGRNVGLTGNTAQLEFKKVSPLNPSTSDVDFWVAVGDATNTCQLLEAYETRTMGVWPKDTSTIQTSVSVWPSEAAFNSAPCGAKKYLFVITGGGGGFEHDKQWFQRDPLVFTKTCN